METERKITVEVPFEGSMNMAIKKAAKLLHDQKREGEYSATLFSERKSDKVISTMTLRKRMNIMEKVMFDITGMRCENCAIGIGLMLGKVKGIKNAKVSLYERTAIVEYDPSTVTISDIEKNVKDFGYGATAK